ncbi:leukotriene A-4 hydrolase-like [Oscarella lobularis]|uniref:leukotriene A-4 hydrolase-like n=1 Tax=Oscarella lobularis TaxID=121494 RepID=UPI0033139818
MPGDPNSFAQPKVYLCTHIHLDLEANFGTKTLDGHVELIVVNKEAGNHTLVLDTNKLDIRSVIDCKNDKNLEYVLDEPVGTYGRALKITLLKHSSQEGAETKIRINYATTPASLAVQWLTPEQTAGKRYPYLFTQCQSIMARSMFPCQDTPSVKITYTATITVPEELTALMSAVAQEKQKHSSCQGKNVCSFEQKVPIPSYLIALAVGDVESRDIGPRTRVWSEKEVVDQAAYEFADTEKMLVAAEEMLGPYVWGRYDLLVLPPSFPFGGMENPCLTFVTPTLLAGDRSLANVVAHEAAHSWTGNLVTNYNWEHFWMNEGFTVYFERRILGALYDEETRQFAFVGGWNTLQSEVNRLGSTNPFTCLVTELEGEDPDETFSSIPYEKGSAFLYYLETLVGGRDKFQSFLYAYIQKFEYGTVTTHQWRDFLFEYYKDDLSIFDPVDWNAWLHKPGMPVVHPKYDTTLSDACTALRKRWVAAQESDYPNFSMDDIKDFSAGQTIEFLSQLLLEDPFPLGKVQAMQTAYNFNATKNSEIRFQWLRMCTRSEWEESFPLTVTFITSQGRGKFVNPLYRDLYACPKSSLLAVDTFLANEDFYHSSVARKVRKDLGLA